MKKEEKAEVAEEKTGSVFDAVVEEKTEVVEAKRRPPPKDVSAPALLSFGKLAFALAPLAR
jgi:hypothetical protein